MNACVNANVVTERGKRASFAAKRTRISLAFKTIVENLNFVAELAKAYCSSGRGTKELDKIMLPDLT